MHQHQVPPAQNIEGIERRHLRRFRRIFAMYAFAAALPFTRRPALEPRPRVDEAARRLPLALRREPLVDVGDFFRRRRRDPEPERDAAGRNIDCTAGVCWAQPC